MSTRPLDAGDMYSGSAAATAQPPGEMGAGEAQNQTPALGLLSPSVEAWPPTLQAPGVGAGSRRVRDVFALQAKRTHRKRHCSGFVTEMFTPEQSNSASPLWVILLRYNHLVAEPTGPLP